MTKSIYAAAYVRMSSDKQEASPQQQRDEIDRLTREYNYKIGLKAQQL